MWQNHHERNENTQLRTENEKLRAENLRYKEALTNASCPNCGGPAALGEMSFDEHHLRIENARLREEVALLHLYHKLYEVGEGANFTLLTMLSQIDRISGIAAKYVGKPLVSYALPSPAISSRSPLDVGVGGELFGVGVSGQTDIEKPVVVELAVAAMEELFRMAQLGEPLWIPGPDNATEILNEEEYVRAFPRGIGPKPFGLNSEASRETAVVIMNQMNVVEMLMDVVWINPQAN